MPRKVSSKSTAVEVEMKGAGGRHGERQQITLRIPQEMGAFIAEEARRLERENPGLLVTPSDVVRMCVRRLMKERGIAD